MLANNDNMALGAIEALKANGYFGDGGKYMPVVGVDATAPALESHRAGELLGTVLNDAMNQGKATFNLACVLAGGGTPTAENTGYDHRRPVHLGALRPDPPGEPQDAAVAQSTRGAAWHPGSRGADAMTPVSTPLHETAAGTRRTRPLLDMRGMTKTFPGVTALDDVDLARARRDGPRPGAARTAPASRR